MMTTLATGIGLGRKPRARRTVPPIGNRSSTIGNPLDAVAAKGGRDLDRSGLNPVTGLPGLPTMNPFEKIAARDAVRAATPIGNRQSAIGNPLDAAVGPGFGVPKTTPVLKPAVSPTLGNWVSPRVQQQQGVTTDESGQIVPNEQLAIADRASYATDWWNRPGATISVDGSTASMPHPDRPGQLISFTPTLPDWAPPGYQGKPKAFYDFLQGIPADLRPGVIANFISDAEARRQNADRLTTAAGYLDQAFGTTNDFLTEFRDDPGRQSIEDALRLRTSPDYSVIDPAQEAAARNLIAQSAARAGAANTSSAAARGVLGSGNVYIRDATLRAIADSAGVQLASQVAGTNQAAREDALGNLGRWENESLALENEIVQKLNQITQLKAALNAGVQVEGSDLLAFSLLGDSREFRDEQMAQQNRHLGELAQGNETTLLDVLTRGIEAAPGFFGNALGAIFG